MLEKDVFRLVTSVYLAIRIREIVCFELDKEIEKMLLVWSRACGKEKILSPHEDSSL